MRFAKHAQNYAVSCQTKTLSGQFDVAEYAKNLFRTKKCVPKAVEPLEMQERPKKVRFFRVKKSTFLGLSDVLRGSTASGTHFLVFKSFSAYSATSN